MRSLQRGTPRQPGGRSFSTTLDNGHASAWQAYLSRAVESKRICEVDFGSPAALACHPPEVAARAAATALRMTSPSPEPPCVRRSRADTESRRLSPLSSDNRPRTEAGRMVASPPLHRARSPHQEIAASTPLSGAAHRGQAEAQGDGAPTKRSRLAKLRSPSRTHPGCVVAAKAKP